MQKRQIKKKWRKNWGKCIPRKRSFKSFVFFFVFFLDFAAVGDEYLGFESERVDACVLLFARILLHRVLVSAASCISSGDRVLVSAASCFESERVDACVLLLPPRSYYYVCPHTTTYVCVRSTLTPHSPV